jgi:hypothetical protein
MQSSAAGIAACGRNCWEPERRHGFVADKGRIASARQYKKQGKFKLESSGQTQSPTPRTRTWAREVGEKLKKRG